MTESKPLDKLNMQGSVCPLPLAHEDQVILGHGSGGKLTQELIERIFYPPFENPILLQGDDAARVSGLSGGRLAVSTDMHIVAPLFFPGGDIGRLAVCGTVNDLAMVGALARYLTAGFILEEGLPLETLRRVAQSMRSAAEEAGVAIIAGDTKVAERGKADAIFINTTGVGVIPETRDVGGARAQPGDAILLSGTVGDHGIAVMAARGQLAFETALESDVAPLNGLVESMFAASRGIHVLRDPTRGGLATALNEIARQSGVAVRLQESAIPVRPEVKGACEMLGFDPLYVANEGKLVAIVAAGEADAILDAMRSHPLGEGACRIGEVSAEPSGRVLMHTGIGGTRVVDTLAGEMLPRIC
jgi:hydrogenase expression/formation protein HypE